ncbi:MAG TPA: MFS transporter [Pseudomonadales bacterium]|nr:MFS transporter [Pseudomonadales bacterium]
MLSIVPSGLPAGIYWRLSGFYFFYFIVLGTMVPYLSLYLKSLGLDAWHIGLLTSVMLSTKIVAPNLWGWLADKSGKRMLIIRMGCLLAVLFFSGIFFWKGTMALAIIIFCYSFFWNAVLAQFEAVTLFYLGSKSEHYSRIRLWGSIGFIIAVAIFGWLFDHVSLDVFPAIIVSGLLAIFLSSWLVVDPPVIPHVIAAIHKTSEEKSFFQSLRQPHMVALFSVCFLMVLSHGPFYAFFSLLMERYQHTRTTIGLLWSLGVLAEVGIFWIMHRLLPFWGVRQLLLVSLAVTAVRWLLLALFPQLLSVMIVAQTMHAFSFAAFHSAAIEAVRRFSSRTQSGQAQAFYSAVGYGAGNALGALLSGWLWRYDPALPYLFSALVCVAGFFVVWRHLPAGIFAGEQ